MTTKPDRAGRYELGSLLGRGAAGSVYQAFDPFVGRDVAVKLARADAASDISSEAWQHDFFAEARAAGRLSHPHIVGVYDAGIEPPWCFIVMEYVAGTDLSAWGYQAAARPPVHTVLDVLFRCAKALDYAHRQGVFHRDIKPANILLTADGQPQLTDFSIARMHTAPATQTGITHGTPAYMAPEQLRGQDVGPATDLYGLGVVLFELLTGRRPFEHPDVSMLARLIKSAPAPTLQEIEPDAPEALEDVVAQALMKDPADRFQSGAEFAAALGDALRTMTQFGSQVDRAHQEDLLGRINFFADFAPEQVDALLEAGTMQRCSPGDTLIREGETDQNLYILVEGEACVRKGEVTLETLGPGDCFGEMAFLAETRRSADIVAQSRCVVLQATRDVLERAPAATQALYYRTFCTMLIHRLARTTARLAGKPAGE